MRLGMYVGETLEPRLGNYRLEMLIDERTWEFSTELLEYYSVGRKN
ncbi:predicted protein [Sclerotinia sclerotiorum 1980 UF-70]|uniref:Uncharacterized protein n=1 Tax=Sclerotinia sclerotiorum (strain ATCC 18683 / 1980 / Ss-1) TaxID=665079 RepID=A7ECD6_SCLS1|nr:predicted protein [Sclerotinia sclerotiorum 1980 UF-70]EDO00115.1 predicted protein [Sclerotinia sclerotiorum 1980 UF-70]